MNDWTIVTSKSGYGKDGFPIGEILCRDQKVAEEVSKGIEKKDLLTRPFLGEMTCQENAKSAEITR